MLAAATGQRCQAEALTWQEGPIALRLDGVPPSQDAVELNALATGVVRGLAPWAIGQRRMIGLDGPDQPVWVSGKADAIEDALRNLIENAVGHSPPQTEVTVTVLAQGAIRIADHGPGIPEQDRQRIFERFWRGRAARGPGRRAWPSPRGSCRVRGQQSGGVVRALVVRGSTLRRHRAVFVPRRVGSTRGFPRGRTFRIRS